MEEHKYKANPVNYKALESCGDLGVPKLVSKESTVCEPFAISLTNKLPQVQVSPVRRCVEKHRFECVCTTIYEAYNTRLSTSRCSPQKEETVVAFKAKPINKEMLQRPLFIPKPSEKDLTEVTMLYRKCFACWLIILTCSFAPSQAHSPVFQTKVRAAAHTSTCAPVEVPSPPCALHL